MPDTTNDCCCCCCSHQTYRFVNFLTAHSLSTPICREKVMSVAKELYIYINSHACWFIPHQASGQKRLQLMICKCCWDPYIYNPLISPTSQVVACCMMWHLLLVIVGDHPSFTRKWRRVSMKTRTFYPRHELTSEPFNASIALHCAGVGYIEVKQAALR